MNIVLPEVISEQLHSFLLASTRPTLLLETGSERAASLATSLAARGYRAFTTATAGQLEEAADAADAALRFKDVLFAAGERADTLSARARMLSAVRTRGAK